MKHQLIFSAATLFLVVASVTAGIVVAPRRPAAISSPTPRPRVVVDTGEHDFGLMNPGEEGECSFRLRNAGARPLTIKPGLTTCRCLFPDLQELTIPPGGSDFVRLTWRVDQRTPDYERQAKLITNDPLVPELVLTLRGQVRTEFVCVDERLDFGDLLPDETGQLTTTFFSQVWSAFDCEILDANIPGLAWNIAPIDPTALARYEAQAGYRVQLTLPPGLPAGYFTGSLRVRVAPRNPPDGIAEEPREEHVTCIGRVQRRLALFGDCLDNGTLALGSVDVGTAKSFHVLLKVRDAEKRLPVKSVTCTPSSCTAIVTAVDATNGLYRLQINVPSDAQPCSYPPAEPGHLRVEFDHPRIPSLELPVTINLLAN